MKKINFDAKLNKPIYLCLGYFDCLHSGHLAIINAAIKRAKETGSKSALLTYSDNFFIALGRADKPVFTLQERTGILKSLPLDYLIVRNFDEDFRKDYGFYFLNGLLRCQNIAGFVSGTDYRCGSDGCGADYIRTYANKHKIEYVIVDDVFSDGEKVSSTLIRNLLADGGVERANSLMLAPFFISGKVEKGRGDGHKLGFPTANIKLPENKTPLKFGVYIAKTKFDGKEYVSVANVGDKPTFADGSTSVEAHILNFDDNLYGQRIKVDFYKYLREVSKFGTADELAEIIRNDIKSAEEYFI